MSLEEPLVGIFDKDIQVDLNSLTINIHDSVLLSTYISKMKDELIVQRRDLKRSAFAAGRRHHVRQPGIVLDRIQVSFLGGCR